MEWQTPSRKAAISALPSQTEPPYVDPVPKVPVAPCGNIGLGFGSELQRLNWLSVPLIRQVLRVEATEGSVQEAPLTRVVSTTVDGVPICKLLFSDERPDMQTNW